MAAKVLLVEDDNNLREIYEARLLAEGYEIKAAKDGEEALVVAKSELPDLVISDVMMPRISGFEMLDILRNTDTLRDTKVIMLTALGQADDKTRANSLGADRYLVKSQVTLEDIVKTAHELLEGAPAAAPFAAAPLVVPLSTDMSVASEPTAAPAFAQPLTAPVVPQPQVMPAQAMPVAQSPIVSPVPVAPISPSIVDPTAPQPAPTPQPVAQSATDQQQMVNSQIEQFIQTMPTAPPPVTAASQDDAVLAAAMQDLNQHAEQPAPSVPLPPAASFMSSDSSAPKKIVQPLNAPASKPSIHDLLAQEEAASANQPAAAPATPTVFMPTNGAPLSAPLPAEPLGSTQVPAFPPSSSPTVVPVTPPQPTPAPTQPVATSFDPNSIAL